GRRPGRRRKVPRSRATILPHCAESHPRTSRRFEEDLMTAPEWFDICSPDALQARTFYQEMFGWPVHVLDDNYTLIGTAEEPIGGIGQDGPDRPYTGIVVYFRV